MTERGAAPDLALRLPLVVLRCQAGDERAFAHLMEWFGARTLRYLRGLVGDEAEDVQQEVWLAVYRGIAGLTDVRAFRTWLFRTTRHRAIDHLRRRRREHRLFVERESVETIPVEEEAESAWPDESSVEAVLSHLPPLQREVLLLRYQDELSYEEIALIVGCAVGTVRSRLHYARERLRDLLKPPPRPRQPSGAPPEGGSP